MKELSAYIDHTILKPTTTHGEVVTLCQEAQTYQFAAVCIPPVYVATAAKLLERSTVKVATVIGFPFGYSTIDAKVTEIQNAIDDGADELDIVINQTAVQNSDYDYLSKEIVACLQAIRLHRKVAKVIIESGVLTEEQIIKCCTVYAQHKVDFVKTSTGYAEQGAAIEAITLMRKLLPADIEIKASGGIRTFEAAKSMIAAGATRIGTSSGVRIVGGS